MVLPFLEGIHIKHPMTSLRATGYSHFELTYPGMISAPLIAWKCGGDRWSAVFTTSIEMLPVTFQLRVLSDGVEVKLECHGECAFKALDAKGEYTDMARAVAAQWNVGATAKPLASRYNDSQFLVHRWISSDGSKSPVREEWDAVSLDAHLKAQPSTALTFVYGLDPGGVDMKGEYFWTDDARDTAKRVGAANPRTGILHWLNIRTYKYAIPAMGIDEPLTAAIRAQARLHDGKLNDIALYTFKAWEMCLGSAEWQASRLRELNKLLDAGVDVVAIDEFPSSPHWGADACEATNHLHEPNDLVDEWRVTMRFIQKVAAIAHGRGALLSTEEPSAVLLPYVSGYMDGTFNEPADFYQFWTKSPDIAPIPLFSTMFGDRMTPYTRPDVVRGRPRGWIIQRKISKDRPN